MGSDNSVYIAMKDTSNRFSVFKFNGGAAPPVGTNWKRRYDDSTTMANTVMFGSSESEIIVGGNAEDWANSKFLCVTRMTSSGSSSYDYCHNFLCCGTPFAVRRM